MRSDGDTWDIANSVGATALGVAALRAHETVRPDAMIRDEYARLFVEAAGDPAFIGLVDNLSTAGPLSRTMGLRTRFFDEFFGAATTAGIRQAVVVAAGLDARSYRMEWPAGTTVFEIDQPKVLEFKQRVLDEHHVAPRARLRAVPVDLREDWPAMLARSGFAPVRPTAWSAEGLLPYLPGAAQDSLFERIDALSAPGSQVAMDCFIGRPDMARFLALEQVQFDKTPFGDIDVADLFYDDDRNDPIQWLTGRDWFVETISLTALAERYHQPIPTASGEIPDMSTMPAYLTAKKK